MNVITTTNARKNISEVLNTVTQQGTPVFLTRNSKLAAVVRKPTADEVETFEIMWLAQESGAFDFVNDEPDLYTTDDLVETYA